MNEVLDFYQQQAKKSISPIPWLAELQAKGLYELATCGFPTRQDEDWKYTLMDQFLQQRFVQSALAFTKANINNAIQTSIPSSIIESTLPINRGLTIQNGQVLGANALVNRLPAGVLVQPLDQAFDQQADKIKPYLDRILQHEHGFHALNTAMLHCGVFIYLPAGVHVEEPIVLSHWQDQDKQAIHNRYLIVAEENSQATIIEEYRGTEECSYFSNTVTEVLLSANAKLVHHKIQCEGKSAYHIGHLSVQQLKGSQFESHLLSLGGKLVRSDISLCLQEEESLSLMNGIYAPTQGQHMDHHTKVDHLVPNCQSEQDYKGILSGHSRAVFNGKVIVAKGAQHTHARQYNKNLLLSSQAEIDTKPQLEIFADDVICTHGATVGQLDEDALFYMASRGIDRREASSYLIHAFAADNLRFVPDAALADWMATLLNEQLR